MRGETILCFGTEGWDSLWRSTQQYMSRMAVENRVLYFEPGRRPDRSVWSEMLHNLPNFIVLRPKQVHNNLILIPTPSQLPIARQRLPASVLKITAPLVGKCNSRIVIRHVRRAMRVLNVRTPILWLLSPGQVKLLGKFGEKLACYFNYDEFANFVENSRIKESVRRLDNQLSRQADVVFATSRSQWERRKAINPNTYFIPNGVDFELFNRALIPGLPLPADMANIPHPIVGYAGLVGSQLDLELLRRVAAAYPHCSLVFVGPDEIPKSQAERELRARPNAYFLGRKDRSELPNYLQVFDVALIPYALRGFVLTAYPLKLHEYLAAGRAIVATAMPELRPFGEVVRIAETTEEFVHQVGQALNDRSPQSIERRIAVAREHTWDQRFTEICCHLQNHLCAAAERGDL